VFKKESGRKIVIFFASFIIIISWAIMIFDLAKKYIFYKAE